MGDSRHKPTSREDTALDSSKLGKLFTPFTFKNLTLKNRTVMAPMTRNFSPGYVPGENVADYYRRRAEGGVGLIITEGTTVPHKASNGYEGVPAMHGDQALAGWQKVVDSVHQAGGKIAPQIWHVGAVRRPGVGPDPQVPGYSPSGVFKPGKPNGEAMTASDIDEAVNAFGQAAENAKRVGFDAIEIHGAHGYLIDQFFWDGTNQRDDAFGGALADRTKFGVAVVKAVRSAVGDDFPVIFRYSQWKQQDYAAKLADTPKALHEFLAPLVEAGVDAFHASTRRFWEPEFEGDQRNLAGWTKHLTGKPAITVGSVGLDSAFVGDDNHDMRKQAEPTHLDALLERLEQDEFDLVAIGRALLVDPMWVRKVQDGQLDDLLPFTKDALKQLI